MKMVEDLLTGANTVPPRGRWPQVWNQLNQRKDRSEADEELSYLFH
jgi:hypothetical protein